MRILSFPKLLLSMLCLTLMLKPAYAEPSTQLSQRADVQAFIQKLVREEGFNAQDLNRIFNQVQLQPKVIESISHPAEAKKWDHYETVFITDERVYKGFRFWKKHQKTLATLQNQYGVPASIIVAILGVETFYGERQGKYRVMDALTTLSFEYPPRQKFFQKELAEYLRLVRDNRLAPFSIKGSYAGAMGLPQFMPSSYRNYAVPYADPHYVNLQKNSDDAMASIANYLKQNGWQAGKPIADKLSLRNNKLSQLITPNAPPTQTLKELKAYGLEIDPKYSPELQGNLILLDTDTPRYYLGFNNFYTIMRYNVSLNYAMAVYTLSDILNQCWQNKVKDCSIGS